MTSERIQQRIERLLDQAEAAADQDRGPPSIVPKGSHRIDSGRVARRKVARHECGAQQRKGAQRQRQRIVRLQAVQERRDESCRAKRP